MLKLTDPLPEKICWNLVQGAAEERPCAIQWPTWLNKEPEEILFSSWLELRWLWHRTWRDQVKSLQKNSWSSEKKRNRREKKKKKKKSCLRTVKIFQKKCLITMPASFEMLFQGFRLSDSSKISSSWGQSLLVMSIKHFSMRFVLPTGRQYDISTRDCTGTWQDLFSTILTCWVTLKSYFSLCLSVHIFKGG